jgi:hypothetical protein
MFHHEKREVANFRADYAKRADFCEVFERDMKPFYMLAFLLTANHKEAEQCFASTVDEGCEENSVFKAWVASWVKRCLVRKAIQVVFSCSARSDERRNFWCEELGKPTLINVVNRVTGLEALERFVFVMSILEGYSTRDCSLLLNCTMESVVQLRARASCRFAASDPLVSGCSGATT